jgi:RecB family exonuclease
VEPDKVSIVDYKTGTQTPSKKDVLSGFAPQLVLGAVMVMHNGVEGLKMARQDTSKLHNLEYWVISGKSNYVASIAQDGALEDQDMKSVCEASYEGLKAILQAYSDGAPFVSFPYGSGNKAAPFSGDYEHLSRLREWSVHDDDNMSGEG